MRKQPRLIALLTLFLLVAGVLAADLSTSAETAYAQTTKSSVRKARAKRQTKVRRSRVRRQRKVKSRRSNRRRTRSSAPVSGDVWYRLRVCESGNNYHINTGNGYYGAYQFSAPTWRGLGYGGLPHQAAPATQDEAARRLQARDGWRPWPACARKLGLR